MKNSQRAGSQDDRAGTARMRRWSEEKPSVRLFLVAFVLVLTGALVWAGWFASAIQAATWTPPSVRLFLVAFVLVLTGALVWAGWFASAIQAATWTPVLVSIAVVGAVAPGKKRRS